MTRLPFFYTEALLEYDMGPQHPMRPERLRNTRDLIAAYGLFNHDLEEVEPALAPYDDAAAIHSRDYLETIHRLDGGDMFRGAYRYGFGTGDNPVFPGIYEASLRYTGASLDAAQAVLDGAPVAFNISGGLHHAHYDRAAGFCVLNDPAVAIRRLQRKYARVAYIDIDVHHGDGVQELFYADPTVLTLSLHQSGRTLFPGTGFVSEAGVGAGEGYSVNLPFAPYTTDEIWLGAWRAGALPILQAFRPDAILLQTGADAHVLDPLANICLTAQGWLEAVKDVQALGVPIVAVGGGGYNMTTVPRMWTLAVATLAGVALPDSVPSGYRLHRQIPTLTDHTAPAIRPTDVAAARAAAEEMVDEVKETLFDRHGLAVGG